MSRHCSVNDYKKAFKSASFDVQQSVRLEYAAYINVLAAIQFNENGDNPNYNKQSSEGKKRTMIELSNEAHGHHFAIAQALGIDWGASDREILSSNVIW